MSEYHAVVHDIEVCVDGLGDSVLDPLMGFEEEVTGSLSRLKTMHWMSHHTQWGIPLYGRGYPQQE